MVDLLRNKRDRNTKHPALIMLQSSKRVRFYNAIIDHKATRAGNVLRQGLSLQSIQRFCDLRSSIIGAASSFSALAEFAKVIPAHLRRIEYKSFHSL